MGADHLNQWSKQMRSIWELRETDELVEIWQRNNRAELTAEALEVIGAILVERIGELPPQNTDLQLASQKSEKPIFRRFWPMTIIGIIVLLIALYFVFLSKRDAHVIRDETRSILLTKSNHQRQLIYENEDIRITIGYDQFIDFASVSMQNEVNRKPVQQDGVLLDKKDEYIIAEALELGKASVFDKRRQVQVTRISVRYYEYICGALCGSRTRSFYLSSGNIFHRRGTPFFEVMDWIS